MIIGIRKNYFNYLLDILLFSTGLSIVLSSTVIWFIIPRGLGLHGDPFCSKEGMGPTGNVISFLGWRRYNWIDFHNWTSVGLFVIVVIHVILHWSWIVETTKRFFDNLRRPIRKVLELYTSIALLLLLFIFDCLSGLVLWLVLPRGARDYYNMIAGSGRKFLGLQRIVWVDLHAWAAVIIVSIIIIHLMMNWDWVAGVTKRLLKISGRTYQAK